MAQSVVTWRGEVRRARRLAPAVVGASLILVFIWLRLSGSTSWGTFIAVSVVVGIAAAFLAFAFRPRFFCPSCNKHIPTGLEWVCGYCDSPNGGPFNTFLHSCSTCGRAPVVLICPYPHRSASGEIEMYPIQLSDTDEVLPHPARKLTPQQPGETIEQAKARWVRERQFIEAEMLSASAIAKSNLARSKRQETASERELEQAFRAPSQIPAASRAEQQGKQLRDRMLARFKELTVTLPELHRGYEDFCRSIDAIAGLPAGAKEGLKRDLAMEMEATIRKLSADS